MYHTERSLRAVFYLLGTSQLVSAQFGTENWGNGKTAPWGLTYADFESSLEYANATGTFSVPGPDISRPYPASTIDGWSWSILVTADMAISNSTSENTQNEYGGKFFTGSELNFNAPPSLRSNSQNVSVDSSWKVCVMRWDIMGDAEYPEALRGDDGTCHSVLSPECTQNIEKAAIELSANSTDCSCPDVRKACGDEDGLAVLAQRGCSSQSFNATKIQQWPDGRFVLQQFGGNPHEKDNITAYNETGSIAWPVMVVWAQGKLSAGGHALPMNNTAKMSCVRAKDGANGSAAPGITGMGENSGYRNERSLFVAVFMTAICGAWSIRLF